jgi:NAD(P)-dependent dehydrogenase (short-subunit alcohol dehydrogenase family)
VGRDEIEAMTVKRQSEQDLSGQVAIVTGASRGIGKRAALALGRRGAKVVVTARTVDANQSDLPGTVGLTASEIEALGGEALAVGADLSKEEDLQRVVATTIERFGGVDILLNNAAVTEGFNWSTPLVEMPREDWLHHFAVNVHAPFTLAQLTVPSMEARGGGRILNVTTGSAEASRFVEEPSPTSTDRYYLGDETGGVPAPGAAMDIPALWSPAYFASKRALDRMSNVIAPQLVPKGWVATEMSETNSQLDGRADTRKVSMDVPARILAYFAACEDPLEYTGRVFFAEREVEALGLELDA